MLARYFTPVRIFGWSVVAALVLGYNAHLDRYITPERGLGYALGIIGGSLMLVLLIYPARKRAEWLRVLGGVPLWYRTHMTLGIVGPLLVLYHANFSLGATNSNVALFCMLAVSGSGLVGRYIYGRVYGEWHEHQTTLEELQATADQLRKQTHAITMLPDYLGAIESEEQRLFRPATTPLGASDVSGDHRSALDAGALAPQQPHPAHGAGGGAAVADARRPRQQADRDRDELRHAAPRCRAQGARAWALRQAVFPVAPGARAVLHHAAGGRNRARDFGDRILTGCNDWGSWCDGWKFDG